MFIKEIKIKNFRNIKDVSIDFSANSAGSMLDLKSGRFIDIGGGKILPKIISIIGPNAVGKTNLFKSLQFANYVVNKINDSVARKLFLENNKKRSELSEEDIRKETKKLLKKIDSTDDSKIIEKFLKLKKNEINYLYQKEAHNTDKNIDIYLKVFLDNKIIEGRIIVSKDSIKLPKNQKIINMLQGFKVYSDRFFNLMSSHMFKINDKSMTQFINKFGREKIVKLFQLADRSIINIVSDVDENKEKIIKFESTNSHIPLSLDSLSSGTQRFISIVKFILTNKNNKGIFFLDELDTYKHKELAEALIAMMNQIVLNNNDISFIFTTQNPMIFDRYINFKQIIELKCNYNTYIHEAIRMSKYKPHENLDKKYKKGIISEFPNKHKVFDAIYGVLNE